MSYEGMTDRRATTALGPARSSEPVPRWSRAKLIAFRFAFAIAALSIFSLIRYSTAYVPIEKLRELFEAALARWIALRPFKLAESVGALIIRTLTAGRWSIHSQVMKQPWSSSPLTVVSHLLGLFILAGLVTILWTAVDRRRANYSTLNRYLRVYLRWLLSSVMLVYALMKVIPTQFAFVTPYDLLRPLGQLSRRGLLWDFMASSSGYTMFTGFIELLGAALLFFRRTTLAGGLVLAGGLTNVVAIDLGYQVGAVHYAVVLLLLDLILLAPYLPGLLKILFWQAGGEFPGEPAPLRQRWYHSPVAKGALFCLLAFPLMHRDGVVWRGYHGTGRPICGLCDVTTFIRDGHTVTSLASDSTTWKRVATWRAATDGPFFISIQFADGDVCPWGLTDDAGRHVWTITQQNSSPIATLRYAVLQDRDVSLDGKFGNDSVHMILHPVDMKKFFPLLTR
jgi:hypothetical protein